MKEQLIAQYMELCKSVVEYTNTMADIANGYGQIGESNRLNDDRKYQLTRGKRLEAMKHSQWLHYFIIEHTDVTWEELDAIKNEAREQLERTS